ncbi:MAG: glycoside hydrolase family 88 protein [Planctomycetaceae bacterium]|nr:glycoside hydrolase family 88 protein [Planctomycetaceae bacterium]
MKRHECTLKHLICWMVAVSSFCMAMTEEQGWKVMPEILSRIQAPVFPDKDFAVTQYGAKGNGDVDCTEAFRKAIAACSEAGGGQVVVPEGTFVVGAIHLKSNVNLHLEKGAIISFFTSPEDYLPMVYTRFEGTECMNYSPLVYADAQENIAITGSGTLDGNGGITNWWRWKWTQKADVTALTKQAEEQVPVEQRIYGDGHKLRPSMIQPYRCKNILIEGVTIKNSPMWHIHPVLSQNITVRNVTIVGHGPNNDGCNPESSRDILIEKCFFDTGDDCIAIKSGRNADGRRVNVASENIIVRGCTMKDGHGGVVIGSEVSGSVRNVFAEDCVMDSPNLDRGLRIKTNSVRGGVIENIFMRNVMMPQVRQAALQIDYYYQEGDGGPFQPTVRNVFMTNVQCKKSEYPWHIRGYAHNPAQNVVLRGCTFENTLKDGIAEGVEGFQVIPAVETGTVAVQWPEMTAYSVMKRCPDIWSLDFGSKPKWSYTYGVVLKAMWQVWEKNHDPAILAYIECYYDTMINEEGQIIGYNVKDYNLDNINAGKVLFELYALTNKDKYSKAAGILRDQMKDQPRTSPGGFWHKQRYPHQMWLDGIYMATPFLAQYAIVYDEPALFDEAAKQIILMNKYARDEKTGLLYHAWDESRTQKWADPRTGVSPNFWGRAMGWYSMALVDTLDYLPREHPQRAAVIEILNDLMEAVVQYQDPNSGLWYQVVDKAGSEGNYLESSCSGMFVYAMLKSIRNDYIPESFMDAAEKGYQGILKQFIEVSPDQQVHVLKGCSVAGLGGNPYRDGSYQYYIGEPVRTDDPKAVGPFIFASLEHEKVNVAEPVLASDH